jgi:hydroxylysine kinase
MGHVPLNEQKQTDELGGSILGAASEEVSLSRAEEVAAQHFGIEGRASRLTSERDQNFKIVAADGQEFALRISNHEEDASINDFQIAALLHVAHVDPSVPVPRVQLALNGQGHLRLPFENGRLRGVRLLSYLQGVPLNLVERRAGHRALLGANLAKLGLALKDFSHAAAGHKLQWDIKHASDIRPLIGYIPEEHQRNLAERFLTSFEVHAKPQFPNLRAQVVHNDLNPYNVLVNAENHTELVGILDFGDMVHTPLAVDVAVGASYFMSTTDDPWDAVAEFVAAYHAVAPLKRAELDLLYDLIAARFVITVAITGWRAKRYPQNSAYILKNNATAWGGLTHLSSLPRDVAQRRLRKACHME